MATQINTEVHGSGDPILFIHGLGGTSNVFGPQVGVLQRFFQCIRPDLPGSGRTKANGAISIESLVDDMLSVLKEQGIENPVHVVAHSMGTIVAQHLALKAPAQVRSLVLIGPIHAPGDAGRAAIRDRAAKARAEGMTPIADAIVQGGTSADTKAHRPEVAALVREILMRQDAEGYALTCEALAAAQAAEVSVISAPTLLITGDEDGTSPPLPSRALAMKIKNARLQVVDRCGHWTTFERPSEVNEATLNFLLSVK